MPKAAKKTAKKTKLAAPVVSEPMMQYSQPVEPVTSVPTSSKALTISLVVLLVALITYKLGPWIFPTLVDNKPITRFALWSRLEKSYGAQIMDELVNEKILDNAIASSHIKVEESKVDEQIKKLESQLEATGGLDKVLTEQGLTRKDLDKQVRVQLSVETLLADKINPSEEEVKKAFDDGAKTTFKDKKFDDVKDGITEELKQTKLREAFLAWFGDVKKAVKLKSFGL